MSYILVLYSSHQGKVAQMAELVAAGVRQTGMDVKIRQVPHVGPGFEGKSKVPQEGAAYATCDDLRHADGLVMGSPGHFGNMTADLKHFIDQTTPLWLSGDLINKPAAVFTSTSSLHGGQESTLLSMMLPLFHHGMVLVGCPYSEAGLHHTQGGGTPYGASHHTGSDGGREIDTHEQSICHALGQRVAELAKKMSS